MPGQPFGDGADGSYNSSTVPTMVYRSCSGTSGNKTLSVAVTPNFANGDLLLIHQTRGTGAGQWEINQVVSGGGTTSLTLKENKVYTYTDSGNSQAQAIKIYRFTDVTASGTWSVPAWNADTGGILVFAANGTTTISGTITASGNNASAETAGARRGFAGGNGAHQNLVNGYGQQGESYEGSRTSTTSALYGGGGGGWGGSHSNFGGGGGGGGAYASNGANGSGDSGTGGTGGSAYGNAQLTVLHLGSGGGGGYSKDNVGSSNFRAGGGGSGAGAVFMACNAITVTGSIVANGGNGAGAWSTTDARGSGGGGSGGSILLQCQTASLGTTKLTSLGGAKGTHTGSRAQGGNGSVGRIAVHFGSSITGTTNPGLTAGVNAIQDGDLIPNFPPYAPADPQCEGQSNPTGVNVQTPTFAWTFSDPDAGNTQTAYQILVGTTSADGSAWDSGKVSSSASSNIVCGNTLSWGTAYKWVVRTWDTYDAAGEYCTEQTFALQNPPTIANILPAGVAATNSLSVTFSATVAAPEAGQSVFAVFTIDGVGTYNGNTVAGTGTSSYSTTLAEGVYTWRALAEDQYGAQSAVSADRTLRVDTTAPSGLSIDGMYCDFASRKITSLQGSGEDGTTLTFLDVLGQVIAGNYAWNGAGGYTFTPTTPLDRGAVVYGQSADSAQNLCFSSRHAISFDNARDVFEDHDEHHGAGASGTSCRLEGSTLHEFKIAVNGGSQVTVSVWMKKNAAYGSGGTQPVVSLSGLGIGAGSATASMSGTANQWEQLQVVATPSARGILTLTVETFSTAVDAKTWIDDISVSQ